MSKLEIVQFPYLSDNYGVLLHSSETGETAAIDAGDATAYLEALNERNWDLSHLLITHHHFDHTEGLEEIKQKSDCLVIGPNSKSREILGLDKKVGAGHTIEFANQTIEVIETPGHTLDMINFYLPEEGVLFAGDTLFTLGCGRVFEGTKEMMWDSLSKLMELPPETMIYSAHEYTLANCKFALSVDPNNEALKNRFAEFEKMRQRGEATVPTTLAEELETNPFLRADNAELKQHLGMPKNTASEVFAELRTRKDNF